MFGNPVGGRKMLLLLVRLWRFFDLDGLSAPHWHFPETPWRGCEPMVILVLGKTSSLLLQSDLVAGEEKSDR